MNKNLLSMFVMDGYYALWYDARESRIFKVLDNRCLRHCRIYEVYIFPMLLESTSFATVTHISNRRIFMPHS